MLFRTRRQRSGRPSLLAGLVACWPLDDASGDRRASFGGLHLTDVNSVGVGDGPLGVAAQFTGTSSHAFTLADHYALKLGPTESFALSLLVYGNAWTVNARNLICRDDNAGAGTRDWNLNVQVGGAPRFTVRDSAAAVGAQVDGSVLSTTTWYLLIAQYDGASQTASISVNAAAEATNTGSFTRPSYATSSFYLGRLGGGAPQYFGGQMQVVHFWRWRLLSDADRGHLYNGGAFRSWPF